MRAIFSIPADQKFIDSLDSYESINFGQAGFLAFKEKSGPLLPSYIKTFKFCAFYVHAYCAIGIAQMP